MKVYFFIILLGWFGIDSCKEKNMKIEPPDEASEIGISLAQYSLHKELNNGKISHFDFIRLAGEMGFGGVEYVSQFFRDQVENFEYLDSMNTVAKKAGVHQLLIMVDDEGNLGELDSIKRDQAVENHKKWIRAAKHLGCHSIRVNAYGEGEPTEVMNAAMDALGNLSIYASEYNINVLVENHGGYSSDGIWLSVLISRVGMSNCGTLPDFGNFCLRKSGDGTCIEHYDKYKGVKELMPFAKAVSAKSYDFDEDGEETTIDYKKMIDIINEANYSGFIGVEYEGNRLSEREGIMMTKNLLKKHL